VLRWYPGYRLEDFYRKSFVDGGVTKDQLLFMFESGDKERYSDQKFAAALQGVDLDGETGATPGSQPPKAAPVQKGDGMLFGSPEDYENMTQEEREAQTTQMMKHWRNFSLVNNPRGR